MRSAAWRWRAAWRVDRGPNDRRRPPNGCNIICGDSIIERPDHLAESAASRRGDEEPVLTWIDSRLEGSHGRRHRASQTDEAHLKGRARLVIRSLSP